MVDRSWFRQMLDSKNGRPSSKRFAGICLVFAGISIAYFQVGANFYLMLKGKPQMNVEETLIGTLIAGGLGAITTVLWEKKDDPNQPTQ